MPPDDDRAWRRPWLRLERLLRAMLSERWQPTAWRVVRREIPKALAQRERIKARGLV